eukprot:Skav231676  [mRNA]  locus=scaffold597:396512:400215:- [translate_table: standard]
MRASQRRPTPSLLRLLMSLILASSAEEGFRAPSRPRSNTASCTSGEHFRSASQPDRSTWYLVRYSSTSSLSAGRFARSAGAAACCGACPMGADPTRLPTRKRQLSPPCLTVWFISLIRAKSAEDGL